MTNDLQKLPVSLNSHGLNVGKTEEQKAAICAADVAFAFGNALRLSTRHCIPASPWRSRDRRASAVLPLACTSCGPFKSPFVVGPARPGCRRFTGLTRGATLHSRSGPRWPWTCPSSSSCTCERQTTGAAGRHPASAVLRNGAARRAPRRYRHRCGAQVLQGQAHERLVIRAYVLETAEPVIGRRVGKSGRTTRVTRGKIEGIGTYFHPDIPHGMNGFRVVPEVDHPNQFDLVDPGDPVACTTTSRPSTA